MSTTFPEVQKFAKTCGFTFKRLGVGYILITPYGEYKRRTLADINGQIIRDNKRMQTSRF